MQNLAGLSRFVVLVNKNPEERSSTVKALKGQLVTRLGSS